MPRWGHLPPRDWLRVPVPSELLLEVTSLFFFPSCISHYVRHRSGGRAQDFGTFSATVQVKPWGTRGRGEPHQHVWVRASLCLS